jgi:hypothetical protein
MLGPPPPRTAGVAVPRTVRLRSARSSLTALVVVGLLVVLGTALAGPVAAADGPTMDARALLQGHARVGSWLAIEVRLQNDGAPIVGELRLQGGAQGGTRFSLPIDLASPADKTFIVYAQPPSFGQQLEVLLVSGDQTIARKKIAFTVHDAGQLIIGVVAPRPQGLVSQIQLPPNQNGIAALTVPLTPADLPDRIEAWSAMDRLIWQDVDTNTLSKEQIAALRGWLALGGRLIIVGGTAGPGVLSGFPDAILPFRPTTTDDVAAASLTSMLGGLPTGAADVPALAGSLDHGRALVTSGDRVVAADATYGSGAVTLIGFDPSVGWIAESKATGPLWRGLIPPRTSASTGITDDSQILGAVQQLPALALPPIGGLLLLLLGYIVLIGPINYIVLRRLDRREWAWITMPALIALFAIGAYGFGSALRGSDVIVNEVAIVRGAPDATEGSAQVYVGIFSPTRGTYQVALPGGALVSAPIVGDLFSGGQVGALDVVQGATARVRDLAVGFGSLRTVRAETPVQVPKLHADLALVNGVLQGTLRNDSDVILETPTVVLGGSTVNLKDIAPGATATVSLRLSANAAFNGQGLSDKIVGQIFYTGTASETQRRSATRHQIIDQLTFDPNFGTMGSLPADVPVVLAWGHKSVVDVEVTGQRPASSANVLFYIPVSMSISGATVFQSDLMRSTVLASDAMFFSKDPSQISFGQGSVTVAYRPIAFDGTFTVSKVHLSLGFGGDTFGGAPGKAVAPLPPECIPDPAPSPSPSESAPPVPAACPTPLPPDQFDGIPEVEVFDRSGAGAWQRLPHFQPGNTYDLEHPERYVDPTSGTLQVRFVNDRQDGVGIAFQVSLEGTVK